MPRGEKHGGWAPVYLIDTSVFTRTCHQSVAEALELLAPQGLDYSPMTGLELRFSAHNAAEWDGFAQALSAYTREPVSGEDFDRADEVQRALAERELRGRRPPNLLIAAQAERRGLVVVHYDHDFELIASITGQPHDWIVPRGSVD